MQHAKRASQPLYQNKKEGNDRLMQHAHRASQPLIQYEEIAPGLMRHGYKGNKGDDWSMRYTHTASQPQS
eukprot:11267174-Ditylum_brightwellii.AAC.1